MSEYFERVVAEIVESASPLGLVATTDLDAPFLAASANPAEFSPWIDRFLNHLRTGGSWGRDRTITAIIPAGFAEYRRLLFPLELCPQTDDCDPDVDHADAEVVTWHEVAAERNVSLDVHTSAWSMAGPYRHSELVIEHQFFGWPGKGPAAELNDALNGGVDADVRLVADLGLFGAVCVEGPSTSMVSLLNSRLPLKDACLWSAAGSWFLFFEDFAVEAWLGCNSEVAARIGQATTFESIAVDPREYLFGKPPRLSE